MTNLNIRQMIDTFDNGEHPAFFTVVAENRSRSYNLLHHFMEQYQQERGDQGWIMRSWGIVDKDSYIIARIATPYRQFENLLGVHHHRSVLVATGGQLAKIQRLDMSRYFDGVILVV